MIPILPAHASIAPIASSIAPVATPASATAGSAFHAVFTDAVSQVEGMGQKAQTSINSFLAGEGEELHQVAIKTQEAELSFDLFMQMRNKMVSAYQEVMRMQV
jgi:flagellar hook-basal body complex protein FliE